MSPPTRSGAPPPRERPAPEDSSCRQAARQTQSNPPARHAVTDVSALDLAGWAVRYATSALAVLPLHSVRDGRCTCGKACKSPGKHPLTRNGKDDATTDPTQVTTWWDRWPWANIGVRPPAGVIILDVDPRHGGATALRELTRRYGPLPPTLTARTGSSGLHAWLACTVPTTRGQLCQGVDIKTHRGYVVAPPSLHASERRYEWLVDLPITAAPDWVDQLLQPPTPARRGPLHPAAVGSRQALAGLLVVVLNAPAGRRNTTLNWAAYRMFEKVRDGRLAESSATGMLLDAATVVGLPEGEALGTIGSAKRAVLG